MATFVPRGQQGLLLRSPIAQGYTDPAYRNKSLLYSRNVRPLLNEKVIETLEAGSTPQKIGFYTRNNPHPGRVKHIKGLLDIPICVVEDNHVQRLLWSAPSSEDFSLQYRPPGSTRYSANRRKHIPAIGIVPVTYAWKDELERKTQKALNKVLGHMSVPSSQQGPREMKQIGQFDHLEDEEILDILCRILQTESIPACQAWLQSSSDSEKNIVLNMLRMAATGEIDPYPTRPQTHHSNYHYVWKPTLTSHEPEQASYDFQINKEQTSDTDANTLFKLPKHDTVIQTAQSRLSSQQSDRSFHDRLQNELDHQANTLRRLQSRHRSSSLSNRPISTGLRGLPSQQSSRPRSRSAGHFRTICEDPFLPPPPVKVSATREKIQEGSSRRSHYAAH